MRAVVQRVYRAAVEIDGTIVARIERGLLVYLGVGKHDTEKDAAWIAEKLAHLRIFADDAGRMNLSVRDVGGEILLVSQFTLYGDCRKGRRPGFDAAAGPEPGRALYEATVKRIRTAGVPVATGRFGAYMQVSGVNDGPVTLLLDSSRLF